MLSSPLTAFELPLRHQVVQRVAQQAQKSIKTEIVAH